MISGVVIAAGGLGRRFGSNGGKQLFEYRGKPILVHTISKFIGLVNQIVVVIQQSDIATVQQLVEQYELPVSAIVASGAQRYDSVFSGLQAMGDDVDYVLVHDGVRPNVSKELIKSLLSAVVDKRAVVPVIPVADTLKRVKQGVVIDSPPRAEFFRVQTPQVFERKLLVAAYSSLFKQGDLSVITDDAMVVERYGQAVYTVEGEELNIKVTVPEDLRYLEPAD